MSQSLGEFLRLLRSGQGMTQTEMAARLAYVEGVSQPWISSIENDRTVPNAGQLEHILRALNAPDKDADRARSFVAMAVVR